MVDFCHLASILTNTNDKADNFSKKRLIASNQLLIIGHLIMLKDDSFIPQ